MGRMNRDWQEGVIFDTTGRSVALQGVERKVRTTQSAAPPNGWGFPGGGKYRECRRK